MPQSSLMQLQDEKAFDKMTNKQFLKKIRFMIQSIRLKNITNGDYLNCLISNLTKKHAEIHLDTE